MKRIKYLVEFFRIVFKKNPLLIFIIIGFPILSGYLTVYIYKSQIDLINAVTNLISTENADTVSVIMPIIIFLSISILQLLISLFGNLEVSKLSMALGWNFQEELINIANKIDFVKLNEREFNDKLSRAKQVIENELQSIIANILEMANIGCSLFSIIVLTLQHRLYVVSILITIMLLVNITIKVKTEIKVKNLNREMTFDGRVASYISKTMHETPSVRELRLFESEDFFLDLWKNKTLHQNSVRYGARKLEIKMGIVVSIIQTITLFYIIYWLVYRINDNSDVTVGLISVLFLNLIQCKNKIFDILWPICGLYLSAVKVRDFNEILKYKDILEDKEKYIGTSSVPIIFDKVNFGYTLDKMIFEELSFEITKGEKIAIVGKNGAGKTTLIKLLLGLYKPISGKILWNGVAYCSDKISVVFQNYARYDLTLRENIALSRTDKMYNDDEIIRLIKKCGIYDLYEQLGGLDVPLGFTMKEGTDISGGQWQRIAIARALYKDSDLLIFDEPTAAIDPNAEVEIFKMLIEVCQDKTAIFISHRLGWTKDCDRIIVLENGKVVEQGNYSELMKERGIYYQMYTAQASWYKEE